MPEDHEFDLAPVATDGGFQWERKPHYVRREHLSSKRNLPGLSGIKPRAVIVGLFVLFALTSLYFASGLTYAHTTFTAQDASVTNEEAGVGAGRQANGGGSAK